MKKIIRIMAKILVAIFAILLIVYLFILCH